MTTHAASTLALGPGDLLSGDSLVKAGLAVVLLIVFAESGLLVGFFLPGDSMLFTLGMLISRNEISTSLPVAMILIGLAAIAGDQVGYLIGRKAGPALFRRPDSRLFKQEYVEKATAFFEKNGAKSIVLARFVPIVRTFTPVIAGVSRMDYRTFVLFNIIGGMLWGCGITLLGYLLGSVDFVHENIEAMLILVVLVSVLPMIIEYLRARRRRPGAAGNPDAAAASPPVHTQDGPQRGRDGWSATDARDEVGGPGAYQPGADEYEPQFDSSSTMRIRRGGGGGGRHAADRRRHPARD
ncbi:DedA family protein [Frankia sp. AgKG'84/4]|uniref:DedA family protein n=1 Tax=Frankia sp. AgKG'84/4 TaxID=573490 RepID=UPI00200F3D61|nr:VTT domain-containing protein [Frankia sp. AgKG'84/4]MCL9795654.1 VTT domain-containing protein [Frankia sp. AgKG'84/4]